MTDQDLSDTRVLLAKKPAQLSTRIPEELVERTDALCLSPPKFGALGQIEDINRSHVYIVALSRGLASLEQEQKEEKEENEEL
ncbi:MAG: hypothetical protein IIB19_07755 [Chloroflexi bacterium]|nr:hypothetical protein [Chloroflexota bacterium]